MTVVEPEVRHVSLQHLDFTAAVRIGGKGKPVVYFHTAGGPRWDRFVQELARSYTVIAPDHPGTGNTERDSIYRFQDLWDLLYMYDELLDRLGYSRVTFIGASFGGMVACELAAFRPERVEKLLLIDPIGIWLDERPVVNWMLLYPEELVPILFENLEAEPVKEFLTLPTDPQEAALAQAELVWTFGATGKFVWPVPDTGLAKRAHRIAAPALIIWGERDRLIPVDYAWEFQRILPNAHVHIVSSAGHVPQWEKLEEVVRVSKEFIG